MFSDSPLKALTGDPCSVDATEDGGFGRSHVVAVEAGDRERLEDMQFDRFHFDLLMILIAEVGSAER